jgi:hypothetical protein
VRNAQSNTAYPRTVIYPSELRTPTPILLLSPIPIFDKIFNDNKHPMSLTCHVLKAVVTSINLKLQRICRRSIKHIHINIPNTTAALPHSIPSHPNPATRTILPHKYNTIVPGMPSSKRVQLAPPRIGTPRQALRFCYPSHCESTRY